MEQTESKLLFWEKLRTWLTLGILVLMAATCVGVLSFARELRRYDEQIGQIVQRVDDITAQLEEMDWEGLVDGANALSRELEEMNVEETLSSLAEISAQLREVDWVGLTDGLGDLVIQAQASLTDAQEALVKTAAALDELDIEALNEAIADLKTVIQPLANFASRFG